ncbi:hypothetical protein [Acinetobacter phage AB1I1M-1]
MSNKVFVYISKSKKVSGQPEDFYGTKITTCNTESPLGFSMQNNPNKEWILEVDPQQMYSGKPFEGILRYGLYHRFPIKFNNIPEMVNFLVKINKEEMIQRAVEVWMPLIFSIIVLCMLSYVVVKTLGA